MLVACKEDETPVFSGVSRIQFGYAMTLGKGNDESLSDSTQNFTFIYESSQVNIDTAYFTVFASGGPVDYDRHYLLEQVEIKDQLNAVSNLHYKPFNTAETGELQVIKAGQVESLCGIVVLRDSSLKENEVSLRLQLIPTKDFETGHPDYLYRTLNITDQITQPDAWDSWYTTYRLGKYSKVKHRFMIDATDQKWDNDWLKRLKSNFSEMNFWVGVLKNKLKKYNNAHPDALLTDEDGDLVAFVE